MRDLVTFLVVALFVFAIVAVGWLMIGTGIDRREQEQARRRTVAERQRAAQERMERRRRLGLPPDKDDL